VILADGQEMIQDLSLLSLETERPKQEPTDASSSLQLVKLEAAIPEELDLESLSELLIECFMRVLEPRLLPDFLGPLAWARLKPSIRKPAGRQFEGHSIALMLTEPGRQGAPSAPVAFCELILMPCDGRRRIQHRAIVRRTRTTFSRSDDLQEALSMLLDEDMEDAAPYLVNFCVSPQWQRRGIGRQLLRLAEQVVQNVWMADCIYLHSDENEAATGFYSS
ncbi:unnamed protein product, partial [Polarella glacialis]